MATEPTIIRAASARDFLGFVPALVGYVPQRSLVLLPMDGPRSIGALRVDLDADAATLAHTTLGLICRVPGATGAVAVIYTDDAAASTRPLAAQIAEIADRDGLHLVDVLYVASDGYGSHLTSGAPRPETEIVTPDTLRERVAASVATDASIPEADADRAEEIAHALDAMDDDDLAAFVAIAEDALRYAPADLDARRAAILLTGIGSPMFRDVALIQWATSVGNGDRAFAAQIVHHIGVPIPEEIARTLWGDGPRPDADRLTAGLAIVRHLAAYADDERRPNLLAAAAWLSWALGRSTHAAIFADLALAVDADHGMSQIVATFVASCHIPAWAFVRP